MITESAQRALPDVIRRAAGVEMRNINDVARLANAIAQSGYFKDADTAQKVAVKMLYAMAMGFDAIAGLQGVDLIEGTPTPNAQLWAAAIEASPLYDYEVVERTDERCTIAFFRRQTDGSWRRRGEVTWTMDDARRAKLAGKDNWVKYPRAMLHWRAMTEGGRAYCPELFGGVRAYVPEEIWPDQPVAGAHIDLETGEVIEMPAAGGLPQDGPTGGVTSAAPAEASSPPADGPDEAAVKALPQRRDGQMRWSVASHSTPGKRYEVTRTHVQGVGRSWSLWSCECADHRFRVRERGERCRHVDLVLAEINERFEDSMRPDPDPAPPRLCTRCGSEWRGPGEICDACVAHEATAAAR